MVFFSSLRSLWSSDADGKTPKTTNSAGVVPVGTKQVLPAENWQEPLLEALRGAEPRLSLWLELALSGVEESGPLLWERLAFLLSTLEAPKNEAEAFVQSFKEWAASMDYHHVAEFRSELQYRLALALDMEDEEDERSRLFIKLHGALSRTREQLGRGLNALMSGHGELTPAFWDELEEVFILADTGVETAQELVQSLRKKAATNGLTKPEELRPILAEELEELFRAPKRIVAPNPPQIVLLIGVNGAGKTTTVAKLAYRARLQGKKVLLVAADTFRAAAVEQLNMWAERTGADFYSKGQGAEPAAVTWEAMDKVQGGNYDLVLVDTAGRLHTKHNLMEELKKVREIIGRKVPGAPHRTVLIIDSTNGQNALNQAKLFKESCAVSEIILTKLDGTSKGGIALAIAKQLRLPISYIGLGEKMEDLRPFDGQDFARALLD